MKIAFPKINKNFSCTEYAPEVDVNFSVWVNPPTHLLAELSGAYKAYVEKGEEARDAFLAPLSLILSQTDNKWSTDELRELQDGTQETAILVLVAGSYFEGNQRASVRPKKSLETATAVLAAGGGTDDYYLARIIQAQHIKNTFGVGIYPWQVDDMPVDWLDALMAYVIDVPKKSARINKVKRGKP
jgi:hypothetical protein